MSRKTCWFVILSMGRNTLREMWRGVLALRVGWGLGRRTQVPRSLQSEVSAAGCGRTALHSWSWCCPLTPSLLLFQASSMPEDWSGCLWSGWALVLAAFWAWKVFQLLPREEKLRRFTSLVQMKLLFSKWLTSSVSPPLPLPCSLRLWIYSLFKIEERFWNWLGVTFEIVRSFPGVCGFVFFF